MRGMAQVRLQHVYISISSLILCVCLCVCVNGDCVDTQHRISSTSYANLMGDEWHIFGREGLSLFSSPSFLFIVFLFHRCKLHTRLSSRSLRTTILLIKKYLRMVSVIESDRSKTLFYIHLHNTHSLVPSNWICHYSWVITQNDWLFRQQD
jgi:hypothetical protein